MTPIKKLTILTTSIGNVETDLSVDEAFAEVKAAIEEWRLARFTSVRGMATVNIDGEHTSVHNDRIRYLNLEEVKVFGYDDNTYSPIVEDEKEASE